MTSTPGLPVILHVADRLTGGVPVAVRNYVENSPVSFEHAILSPFKNGAPSPIWSSLRTDQFDLGTSRMQQIGRIRQTIAAVKPAVIHAHSSFPGALTRIATNGEIPVVYSPHCFKFDDPSVARPLRSVFRSIERVLSRRTHTFAVLSAHEELLARSLGRHVRTVTIPNVPSLAHLAAPSRVPLDRIGMIGRLSAQKDPEFMALLVAQLRETYATLDSVWIGDGEPRLRDRLTQSGIKVTGWLPQDDVVHELDKLKLYVHTAAYEGFPLSVLDVAARRVPIIARRIPALEEAGLRTFDTIAEGVALAKRALADESFRTELQRAGDAMLSRMNTTTQRAALERAWRADA